MTVHRGEYWQKLEVGGSERDREEMHWFSVEARRERGGQVGLT